MRHAVLVLLILSTFLSFGCTDGDKKDHSIHGTWQSLWDKDMKLQLQLNENGRFKVTLSRTGQVHNNLGWYHIDGNTFTIRDSVDYPLPVCNLTDTGRYTFRLNKDTLQFTVVDDKCEKRGNALQLERFVRVE